MRKPCRHQPGGAFEGLGGERTPTRQGSSIIGNPEGWIIQAEDCQGDSNRQQLVASWELGKQTNSTTSVSRHLTEASS